MHGNNMPSIADGEVTMNSKRNVETLVAGLLCACFVFVPDRSTAQSNLFGQLVAAAKPEVEKREGKLSVGMTWTNPQAKPVLEEFKKDFPFVKEVTYTRLRTVEQMQRMLMESKTGRPPDIDIPFISEELWPDYLKEKMFLKPHFPYAQLVKSLPKDWPEPDPRTMDPQGLYIASTGSARGIAYNKSLIPAAQAPKGWEDCIDPKYRGKIIYDTRDRLLAFQHDPKTKEWFLKWLKGLVANKVVLNRGMEENLQKVAAGEFLISCVANYHNAMPLIDEGAPLVFLFPDPYTSDIATEMHVLSWSKTPITTQLFALWLATKAQPLIEKLTYRGFPWVPGTKKYSMTKGKTMALCAADCAAKAEQYDQEHAKIIGLPGAR